jgi:tetratricopeptide (TPR) repeat protein
MHENLPGEDLLMKYLDNEMPLSERQAFEKQLEENPVLKEQLDSLQLARKAVEYYGIHQEVSKVRMEFQRATGSQPQGKVVKMRRPLRYILMAAASVIFIGLIAIGYLFYQLSPENVYNEGYVSYNLPVSRGSSTEPANALEQAYQKKDFRQVTELANSGAMSERDQLLAGLSFMQLNQFDQAIKQFRDVLTSQNPTYKPDAEYYLALSHLRMKQYDEALDIFKKIKADESHLYHKQVSSKMLREIRWLKWKE